MAQPSPSSGFSFGAAHGPQNPPFSSNAPPKPATGFSFGVSPAPQAQPSPSAAPTGFSFGSRPLQPSPPPPAAAAPSTFGGGFGGFGQAAARPSAFGGFIFGQQEPSPPPPPAPFSFATKSLGGGSGAPPSIFGAAQQPTSGGFSFSTAAGGGETTATATAQRVKVEPSTAAAAAAAEVAKPLTVTSFGAEVKPSDMGKAHPSTYQVPPTSSAFSTPAQVPTSTAAAVAQETKQAAPVAAKEKSDEKKFKQKTKAKKVNALAIDEAEGGVEFPSRENVAFRYRLTLLKSDKVQIWLEDKSSKHQWESKELELSEILTKENTIPGMELKDYFEGFASCLATSDGKASSASSCDLLSLDKSGEVQLEISLAVAVFAKTVKPTYKLKLQPVKLSEMDILNAKLRDQGEEIRELRDEVDELHEQLQALAPFRAPNAGSSSAQPAVAPPPVSWPPVSGPAVFLRAVTMQSTNWNQSMVWHNENSDPNDVFRFGNVGALEVGGDYVHVLQDGVFSLQVVVHHTNTFEPGAWGVSFKPAEQPAFHLTKNGVPVAYCYGSSPNGVIQSSSLQHILTLKKFDLLRVHYTGTNQAKEGSYFNLFKLK